MTVERLVAQRGKPMLGGLVFQGDKAMSEKTPNYLKTMSLGMGLLIFIVVNAAAPLTELPVQSRSPRCSVGLVGYSIASRFKADGPHLALTEPNSISASWRLSHLKVHQLERKKHV